MTTSRLCIFELYWVLRSYYKEKDTTIVKVIEKLLKLENLIVEDGDILKLAILIYQNKKIEFQNCFNIAYCIVHEMNHIETFDQKLKKAWQASV